MRNIIKTHVIEQKFKFIQDTFLILNNITLKYLNILHTLYSSLRGPGSSVGIATGYGLDDPGIESRWGRDLPHLSRPGLGPTHLPVKWVLGLSRG
jgi:hypothetical protein